MPAMTVSNVAGKENKYFIPSSVEESERLSILHEVFIEPTTRFLNLAGISSSNLAPISVVDVGCGTGQMTKWLSDNVHGDVLGIDNDMQQLCKASTNVKSTDLCAVKFNCLSILSDDQSNQQFDVVYCRFLLHHLSDPLKAIGNLLRMTKTNGKIIIGEPVMHGRWIYPDYDEYHEIYNLHLKNQSNHIWDPNYGMRLLSDIAKFSNAVVRAHEHFRPILYTEKTKRHHLLVLEIFGSEFVKKGLISNSRLVDLRARSIDIAKDNMCYTDLFGVVFICIEKL